MTYMHYTLELYPIAMPSKPRLPEECAAKVDVHVDATCWGMQQLLLSSPALEMQPLENRSAEYVQLWNITSILCWLNWGANENAELPVLTFLREMLMESWR